MPEQPAYLQLSPLSWRAASLAALLALAACAGGSGGQKHAVTFVCPGGTELLATFYADDDRMRLRVNVFWNKGREALLQRSDGPSYVGCVATP